MRKSMQQHILLVDDVPVNIEIIGTLLTNHGYFISVAENGLKALELVNNSRPDLILLDIMMPGMDGFEVCQRLKKNPATANIPIIFITALSDSENVVKGFELGGVDYVTKPFNAEEVIARVNTHLSLRHMWIDQQVMTHMVCHDLKMPLRAIESSIQEEDLTQEKTRDKILDVTHHALSFIQTIDDLWRAEFGITSLSIFPLKEAVDEVLTILNDSIKNYNITINIDIPVTLMIEADYAVMVNSVLVNLFEFSIKRVPPEGIIDIKAYQKDQIISIEVTDNGECISEQERHDILFPTPDANWTDPDEESAQPFCMIVIRRFTESFGGNLNVICPEEDEGVTVILEFPEPEDVGSELVAAETT